MDNFRTNCFPGIDFFLFNPYIEANTFKGFQLIDKISPIALRLLVVLGFFRRKFNILKIIF